MVAGEGHVSAAEGRMPVVEGHVFVVERVRLRPVGAVMWIRTVFADYVLRFDPF